MLNLIVLRPGAGGIGPGAHGDADDIRPGVVPIGTEPARRAIGGAVVRVVKIAAAQPKQAKRIKRFGAGRQHKDALFVRLPDGVLHLLVAGILLMIASGDGDHPDFALGRQMLVHLAHPEDAVRHNSGVKDKPIAGPMAEGGADIVQVGLRRHPHRLAHRDAGHRRAVHLGIRVTAMDQLVGFEVLGVLLVPGIQSLVDDGHSHPLAGEALLVQVPDGQAGVFVKFQNFLRGKALRQRVGPAGVGAEGHLVPVLHHAEVRLPGVHGPQVIAPNLLLDHAGKLPVPYARAHL